MAKIGLWASAAAAAAFIGIGTPAEAQYYYPGPPGAYQYGAPGYVSPRILRKQRQMQRRVIEKYGYLPPGPRYQQPRYVQPGYGYGYRGPGAGPGYGNPYRAPRPYANPGYVQRPGLQAPYVQINPYARPGGVNPYGAPGYTTGSDR